MDHPPGKVPWFLFGRVKSKRPDQACSKPDCLLFEWLEQDTARVVNIYNIYNNI